ncbi:fatty-acid amide hydrolase 2-A-like [Amblyomma americanum]
MPPFAEKWAAVLVELVVYLWCNAARLFFHVWFVWRTPQPLPPAKDDLLLRSAASLAAAIREGEVKSVQLVSAYIRRIRQVQPVINAAVEERFEEALREAEEADQLVSSGDTSAYQLSQKKPLLGLPFSVKNSIAVKGMRHDAGSLVWHGRRAEEDAPSVALLREAGAIPLVLTNVPEMCMWGDAHNLVDGRTCNPHDTRRVPGGSSGGECSLLASAGSLMGLGTDVAGSVRIPASFCGIFGHKPTAGVVPNGGLFPDVAQTLGERFCVGPLARFSEDLALLLKILAGGAAHRLKLDEQVDLKAVRVYFTETEGSHCFSRVTAEVRRVVKKVVSRLREAHGMEVRRLHVAGLQYAFITWLKTNAAVAPVPLAEHFRPGGLNAFAELVRTLLGVGRHTLPALFVSRMKLFRFSSRQEAEAYLASVDRIRDRLEESLGEDGVLILPVATSTAPYHGQDLFFSDSPSMTALFNIFKMPATACPIMKSKEGLPIGVQVVAKRGNDRLCLAVAREIERQFGGWLQP